MLGYVCCDADGVRPAFGRRQILGCIFVELRLPKRRRPEGLWAGRQAAAAAGRMREMGVRRAIFPVEFPHISRFALQGICPVDPLPLRCALVPHLVRERLSAAGRDPREVRIAITGRHMTPALAEITQDFAIRYRHVILDVSTGGEELARMLRREYGISLLLQPAAEQLEQADVLLLFHPREDLTRTNPICYGLYSGGHEGWTESLWQLPAALEKCDVPEGCAEQLLAALYAAGVLSLEDILVKIRLTE